MSTVQIAVRLQDSTVAWLDGMVADGTFRSRAEALDHFARAEKRRREDANDLRTYQDSGPDPDLDAWAEASSRHAAEVFNGLD